MATSQTTLRLVEDVNHDLEALLLAQKRAFLEDTMPSVSERVQRLDKLHNALIDHRMRER